MIHGNHYRPASGWTMHGTGMMLGVELEVVNKECRLDEHNGINEPFRDSLDKWVAENIGYDRLHVCTDGSVYDGVELVSHPMSLLEHKEMWRKVLEKLVEDGWQGEEFKRYPIGLHIHFQVPEAEDILHNMLNFAINNKRKMQALVGRGENEYVHWGPYEVYNSHYSVFNLRANNIIEFRGCISTVNYSRFIGRLELVCALVKLISKMGTIPSWDQFVVFMGKSNYTYLRHLMKAKLGDTINATWKAEGIIVPSAERNRRTTASA